ncbi:unnamed protein product [Brugia pahangi]|uniref:CFAP91 domain-containing protein n=1 Tax=Brugia pahangi TaxID=6280 RepID=A0A0N4T2B9_BRUPA|nr:unnamed protein product [Brugia pahangi]
MPSAYKSPIGTFYVYEDRVEWLDNAWDEKLVDNEYRHQIKQKTQLQICKHNEEQATFVFVNPLLKEASFDLLLFMVDLEFELIAIVHEHLWFSILHVRRISYILQVHVKHRDLVKEILQQNIIQSLKYNKTKKLEAKKKILERNKLQEIYKHLVASKLISAQNFWSECYQNLVSLELSKSQILSSCCCVSI